MVSANPADVNRGGRPQREEPRIVIQHFGLQLLQLRRWRQPSCLGEQSAQLLEASQRISLASRAYWAVINDDHSDSRSG